LVSWPDPLQCGTWRTDETPVSTAVVIGHGTIAKQGALFGASGTQAIARGGRQNLTQSIGSLAQSFTEGGLDAFLTP
jgi:hypothetical protein